MDIELGQSYSFCQLGGRKNQEDARYPDMDEPHGGKPVFVVCDGVGGQDKGEVASRTVADAFGRYMQRVDLSRPFSADDFSKALSYAYQALDKAMSDGSDEMATTLTFICFHDGGVLVAHIGDSRIYHIRPQVGILYRSNDHSLVNALVHSGNLTPQEAENHPQSNYITRCMGHGRSSGERASATVLEIDDVEAGDYFFLCTDGVLHELDDRRLQAVLESGKTDREKMAEIALACRKSSDNNTAYLIPVERVYGHDRNDSVTQSVETGNQTVPINVSDVTVSEVPASKLTVEGKFSLFIKNLFK